MTQMRTFTRITHEQTNNMNERPNENQAERRVQWRKIILGHHRNHHPHRHCSSMIKFSTQSQENHHHRGRIVWIGYASLVRRSPQEKAASKREGLSSRQRWVNWII